MNQKSLDRLILDDKPIICDKCGHFIEYDAGGRYVCPKCGNEMYDGYGKLKEFVRAHPHATMFEIKKALGLTTAQINMYLDEGAVSIPELEELQEKNELDKLKEVIRSVPAGSAGRFYVDSGNADSEDSFMRPAYRKYQK